MNDELEPTSNALRSLRRAYRSQRYDGDLGEIIDPARCRSIWGPIAAAALLAVCMLIGSQVAVRLRQIQSVARQTQPAQPEATDDLPQLRTLELPEPSAVTRQGIPEPFDSLARETLPERRPVLPGLLVMHSPRATPPPRRTFAPRPSLGLIQTSFTSNSEQGTLP